ncbi:unnamed protein product [Trifolium pratense]|uniref:Uncharacterized protein n=1 Tax=Trifolium pratense TaxID=57577 RepID=A0ACB0LZV4_TRIPR|nr:unnamed protein product [Trifolium pratense]
MDTFTEDPQVKKTLANWREMKKGGQTPREIARLKIEQIQNTARFEESFESMSDFHKIIGKGFWCYKCYCDSSLCHLK